MKVKYIEVSKTHLFKGWLELNHHFGFFKLCFNEFELLFEALFKHCA